MAYVHCVHVTKRTMYATRKVKAAIKGNESQSTLQFSATGGWTLQRNLLGTQYVLVLRNVFFVQVFTWPSLP